VRLSAGTCRCGHFGDGEHPCHAEAYTCRKLAKQRFYNPELVALAGVQMKMQVSDTWACDDHWIEFQQQLKEARAKAQAEHDAAITMVENGDV